MMVLNNQNGSKYWNLKSVFLILLFIQALSGCKHDHKENASTLKMTSNSDKVQVVLKTQSNPYDPVIHKKVVNEYTNTSQLSIPKSLLPQSKWIMFEGPVLENDKVAYRYYADTRHRFDIYGKKVTDLVMDTVSWDYHKIMDWGSDILKVGNSVGLGSPAIFYQDSVYCFENWEKKDIEVINSNDQTATIRTTFYGLTIGDIKMTVQQDWSLSEGNFYSTIDLKRTDGDLPESMKFATGIVKHLDGYTTGQKDGQYFGYNWGIQSFHKQNLGMAIISSIDYSPRYFKGNLSHLTIFDNSKNGVKYQFLSAWAEGVGEVDNEEKFAKEIDHAISKVKIK